MGTPIYSRRYLESVAATFPEITRLCVIYAGTEPAAASLDMLAGDTAEGLWLGSRAKFRRQHAGYVLYWELIKNACERGLKRFHLGRSTTQSGGEVFKKKWNAYPIQLYWQYVLRTRRDIPQLNVDEPEVSVCDQDVAEAARAGHAGNRSADRSQHSVSDHGRTASIRRAGGSSHPADGSRHRAAGLALSSAGRRRAPS